MFVSELAQLICTEMLVSLPHGSVLCSLRCISPRISEDIQFVQYSCNWHLKMAKRTQKVDAEMCVLLHTRVSR